MVNASAPGVVNLPMYGMYIVQGAAIGGSQFLILLCVMRFEALRSAKQYVIVMGLAFADGFSQMAYLSAGIYRTILVLSGQGDSMSTAWQCAMVPHSIIWSITQIFAPFTLTLVSFDRLLCVLYPLEYIGWSLSYTYSLLSLGLAYGVVNCLLGFFYTYQTRNDLPDTKSICIVTGQTLSEAHTTGAYAWHFANSPIVWAVVSVILYVLVFVVYKRSTARLHPEGEEDMFEQQRQNRMTKSLGISCACTFFVYCLPFGFASQLSSMGHTTGALFFWTFSNLNPLCNVFVYLSRHAEIRHAIKAMFRCKTLPANVTMWNVDQ